MLAARLAVAAALLATAIPPASAEDPSGFPGAITGSAALATDYTFRGISQTDNDPAVQVGLEYGVEVGGVAPYLGIWGSNVNFTDANMELDLTGGVRGKFGEVTWDLGFIYYAYPNARSNLNYNFLELAAKAGYDFGPAALTLGLNYSPEFFAKSGDGLYLQANVDVPLPWGITASAHVGRQWIQKNAVFGAPDYLDWSLGAAKEVMGLTLGLAYVDTDLSKRECFAGTTLCGARAMATVTKKF